MLRWVLLVFISLPAFAAPLTLEVWFLSNAKKAQVQEFLNRPQYIYHSRTAALQCQAMGDYCFDPQFGLYKKDSIEENVGTETVIMDKGPTIPPGRSLDRDLINCDSSNYFDIFCGKARAETKTNIKFDLWIDTSGSMKEFDYADKQGGCNRKSFVKSLDESCPFNQKVNVMMFDTSIKQAGSMDALCNNQGLNDYKRLIDWIERSEARKLIIITDIYEFHREFSDYVESKHGIFRGDKEPLTSAQMLSLVDELAKSCK
ncbi:MAG TPA: hypothetical protein VNJ08_11980 [Bacteriovoracaceae bacterium]|nr:hypothetical protein [Bacteriovoracaceae bacterium]